MWPLTQAAFNMNGPTSGATKWGLTGGSRKGTNYSRCPYVGACSWPLSHPFVSGDFIGSASSTEPT